MPSLNHTHTYVRRRKNHPPTNKKSDFLISGERTFMCADPDCTHYTTRSLAMGKRSLCTQCHQPFILDSYTLGMVEPKCIMCRKDKEAREHQKAQDVVTSVLDELFNAPPSGTRAAEREGITNEKVEKDSLV